MSLYTGIPSELIYSYSAAATAVNAVTEASAQATYPAVAIPAGYLIGGGSRSRSLQVLAYGQMTCGSTATNLTMTGRLLTSETWSAGGLLLGSTAAAAMVTSTTAAFWRLELNIWVRTESIGGASTIAAMGMLHSPAGLTAPATTIPATNTAFTVTTLDAQTTYYLFLSGLVSQTTGAPTATLQGLKVYAEN